MNINNSSNNVHFNTSNNISKQVSLNTSFLNNKNLYKEPHHIKESPSNKEIRETTREKLHILKEVLKLLKVKEDNQINREVENIINGYTRNRDRDPSLIPVNNENSLNSNNASIPSNNPFTTKVEKENKLLKTKIEEIDKKFELIMKENKELKHMIRNKAEEYNKLQLEMNSFKKELKNIKISNKKNMSIGSGAGLTGLCLKNKTDNHRHSVSINHNIHVTEKNYTTSHTHSGNSPGKEKSTQGMVRSKSGGKVVKKNLNVITNYKNYSAKPATAGAKKTKLIKEKDNSMDLSRMDTFDLLTRAQVDDPKKVLYLPRKVNAKSNLGGNNIPKLDIVKLKI
jgi:hypothetical protein